MQGRVVKYWPERHYGFIIGSEGPEQFFFHEKDIFPTSIPPKQWNDVEFELGKYAGRQKAIRVRVLPPLAYALSNDKVDVPLPPSQPLPKEKVPLVSAGKVADALRKKGRKGGGE